MIELSGILKGYWTTRIASCRLTVLSIRVKSTLDSIRIHLSLSVVHMSSILLRYLNKYPFKQVRTPRNEFLTVPGY